jgi:hypothetical protein
MREILERAERHGIKFENENLLKEIANLSELREEAIKWRDYVEEEGNDTTAENEIIRGLEEKIRTLRKKLR